MHKFWDPRKVHLVHGAIDVANPNAMVVSNIREGMRRSLNQAGMREFADMLEGGERHRPPHCMNPPRHTNPPHRMNCHPTLLLSQTSLSHQTHRLTRPTRRYLTP